MDRTLIQEFESQRIPRYTSYPTAPHFKTIGAGMAETWLAALDPACPVSLYLHVPFCQTLCWYCGCHTKVAGHNAPIERYVEALEREIALVADRLPAMMRASHLHWGGGTPTIVGPERFQRVMALIRRRFAIIDEAELAIELDPRRLTGEMATALAQEGITRASLGVQSFDPRVQKAINRLQSFDVTARGVELLRRAGITRLNFDLLYGLPHQTVSSCRETVEQALLLEPDRLAVFGYAHVPHLKRHQECIDAASLPDAAERYEQAHAIERALRCAGYVAIGLDHFARESDDLARAYADGRLRRNFQGYTTDTASALIGLGASAISALPQGYIQNTPLIATYCHKLATSCPASARGIALGEDDRLRRDIIAHLMCYLAVDLRAIAASHDVSVTRFAFERAALQGLARQGVIRLADDRIEITEDCRMLARVVAAVFDTYLDSIVQRHSRAI